MSWIELLLKIFLSEYLLLPEHADIVLRSKFVSFFSWTPILIYRQYVSLSSFSYCPFDCFIICKFLPIYPFFNNKIQKCNSLVKKSSFTVALITYRKSCRCTDMCNVKNLFFLISHEWISCWSHSHNLKTINSFFFC